MEWLTLPRVGLLYDIVGALILVYGALTAGKTRFAEADLFWGTDVETKAIATSKLDSIVGVTLLCVGFVGQLLGTDASIFDAFSAHAYGAFAVAFLVSVAVAYLSLRARLVIRYVKFVRGHAA